MTDYKNRADSAHDRQINDIEHRDARRMVTITVPRADLHRAIKSLESRAEWLTRRRDPDPQMKALAVREADSCRRLSLMIGEAVREASR